MDTCSGGIQGAVISIEVGRCADKRQELVLAGEFPAIETRALSDDWRWAAVRRARHTGAKRTGLPNFNRRPQIRISAEDLDSALCSAGRRSESSNAEDDEKLVEIQRM